VFKLLLRVTQCQINQCCTPLSDSTSYYFCS